MSLYDHIWQNLQYHSENVIRDIKQITGECTFHILYYIDHESSLAVIILNQHHLKAKFSKVALYLHTEGAGIEI